MLSLLIRPLAIFLIVGAKFKALAGNIRLSLLILSIFPYLPERPFPIDGLSLCCWNDASNQRARQMRIWARSSCTECGVSSGPATTAIEPINRIWAGRGARATGHSTHDGAQLVTVTHPHQPLGHDVHWKATYILRSLQGQGLVQSWSAQSL